MSADQTPEQAAADSKQTSIQSSISRLEKIVDQSPKPVIIVIVDEDQKDLRTLKEMVEIGKLKNEAHLYNSSVQALQELRTAKEIPDIIMVSLEVPDMDGYEVIRTLRADERFKGSAIVVSGATGNHEAQEKCRQLGANAFLSKPVSEYLVSRLVAQSEGLAQVIVRQNIAAPVVPVPIISVPNG